MILWFVNDSWNKHQAAAIVSYLLKRVKIEERENVFVGVTENKTVTSLFYRLLRVWHCSFLRRWNRITSSWDVSGLLGNSCYCCTHFKGFCNRVASSFRTVQLRRIYNVFASEDVGLQTQPTACCVSVEAPGHMQKWLTTAWSCKPRGRLADGRREVMAWANLVEGERAKNGISPCGLWWWPMLRLLYNVTRTWQLAEQVWNDL